MAGGVSLSAYAMDSTLSPCPQVDGPHGLRAPPLQLLLLVAQGSSQSTHSAGNDDDDDDEEEEHQFTTHSWLPQLVRKGELVVVVVLEVVVVMVFDKYCEIETVI